MPKKNTHSTCPSCYHTTTSEFFLCLDCSALFSPFVPRGTLPSALPLQGPGSQSPYRSLARLMEAPLSLLANLLSWEKVTPKARLLGFCPPPDPSCKFFTNNPPVPSSRHACVLSSFSGCPQQESLSMLAGPLWCKPESADRGLHSKSKGLSRRKPPTWIIWILEPPVTNWEPFSAFRTALLFSSGGS